MAVAHPLFIAFDFFPAFISTFLYPLSYYRMIIIYYSGFVKRISIIFALLFSLCELCHFVVEAYISVIPHHKRIRTPQREARIIYTSKSRMSEC